MRALPLLLLLLAVAPASADAPRHAGDATVGAIWLGLYFLATIGLLLYGFHAHKMLLWKRRHGPGYRAALHATRAASPIGRTEFPQVLVQVPVYNEVGVVERAIDAVCALDWPCDRLEVQVLDDSTDETVSIVDAAVERWTARGVPVRVLRRVRREGFKAGALAAGLELSDAEYVAIFDADFVPRPDFLRQALPLFAMPGRVAVVQGRWAHVNRDQNWLTRAQAIGVDAHFHIVQLARAAAGAFLSFNGTAGVWRREAIDDAGGWRGDTLTEDLDLSYRAQLRGWRIVFDPELVVPAELPPALAAYKSQQRRWACGSMQCARQYLGAVWGAPISLAVKAEATAHLLGYSICIAMMILIVLLPFGIGHLPLLFRYPELWPLWLLIWPAAAGPVLVSLAGQAADGRARKRDVLSCFLLGLGSCANNGLAAVRGLTVPIRTFVRTPKQGSRRASATTRAPVLEQVMTVFTLVSLVVIARNRPVAVAAYAFFCCAGFCVVAAYWWLGERRHCRADPAPAEA